MHSLIPRSSWYIMCISRYVDEQLFVAMLYTQFTFIFLQAYYVETIQSELTELNIAKASLRHDVQLLMENKSSFITLQEVLKEFVNKEKTHNMENECDTIYGKSASANGAVTTKVGVILQHMLRNFPHFNW